MLREKQRWQLFRASETLTIHSTLRGTSLGIAIDLGSTDESYTRQP